MGFQENGNGEMGLSGIPMGAKNKYKRMNNELRDDDNDVDDVLTQQEQEEKRNSTGKYVMACAIFASLNNVLLGYDVGVMSGAVIFIKEDLNISEVQVEILVGILSIISLLGSLGGGRTSDIIGRKWTMALAAIVFQTGGLTMTLAPSYAVLMIGRFLAGIGIGFGVMISPIYIAEISPNVTRGSLTTFPEIFINIGILLGYVSNYAFSGLSAHISWRVMLAMGILPSVIIGFALFVIPESPRWLVMQNRIEEARLVLLKTNEDENEVEERLAEIQQAAGFGNSDKYEEEKPVWRELMFPSPALRRMLITGLGVQCFQQISGIDATVYYSPEILQAAGIEDNSKLLEATVAVGITKTLFILVAIILIDKLGRKPLLMISATGMTVCLFSMGATLSFGQGPVVIALAILFVCGNVAFFSVGLGPVCWVLASEIFPLRVRAQASALGAVANRLCSGLVAMSFLSIAHAITFSGTFFLFGAVSALAIAFVHARVPETKGKSLEQIEMMFQNEHESQGRETELGDVEHLVKNKNGLTN